MHDRNHSGDVGLRYTFVKKVAHGIDENHFRDTPSKRFGQLLRYQPEIKTLFEWMPLHPSESFGKSLSITVFASGADF
jgi:hypothetical protein